MLTGDDGGYETREIRGNSTLKKLVCKGPEPEKRQVMHGVHQTNLRVIHNTIKQKLARSP